MLSYNIPEFGTLSEQGHPYHPKADQLHWGCPTSPQTHRHTIVVRKTSQTCRYAVIPMTRSLSQTTHYPFSGGAFSYRFKTARLFLSGARKVPAKTP
jgi:hypothetical protein